MTEEFTLGVAAVVLLAISRRMTVWSDLLGTGYSLGKFLYAGSVLHVPFLLHFFLGYCDLFVAVLAVY